MTLFEWLQDNVSLCIVEVATLPYDARRVTTWTGRTTFLEYVVRSDGSFTQSDAWSVAKAPADVPHAMAIVSDRRSSEESV